MISSENASVCIATASTHRILLGGSAMTSPAPVASPSLSTNGRTFRRERDSESLAHRVGRSATFKMEGGVVTEGGIRLAMERGVCRKERG